MASCPKEQKVLKSVIEMYKNMPYLWKRDHEDYVNKDVREEGFQVLLKLYQEFDDSATIKMIKKKIENMRTTYLREWKKVLASQQEDEEIYVPTLWYYNMLHCFLNNGGDESCFDPLQNVEVKIKPENENSTATNRRSRKRRLNKTYKTIIEKRAFSGVTSESARKVFTTLKGTEDPLEAYGKSIAFELRDVNEPQMVVCKKIISDAIFYAKLHKLNENSQVVNPEAESSEVVFYNEDEDEEFMTKVEN